MISFLIRRIGTGLATLLVSTFVMYLLVSASMRPFDDLETSTAPNKAQQIADRTRDLDLDTPAVLRYFKWLGNFVTGDLGDGWRTGQTVSSMLSGAIVSTVQLVLLATLLGIVFGVAVGIVSALRQYTTFDYLMIFVSFLLYSLPSFWVAVLLKQWGAIGFNDFLRDPKLGTGVIVGISLVTGLLWQLAIGGDGRRRLTTFAIGAAASAAVFFYLDLSDWWSKPQIDLPLLLVLGVASALAITLLSAGLSNRRALGAALTTVVVGAIITFPLEAFFKQTPGSWGLIAVLFVVTLAIAAAIGFAWGGPDRGVSIRTAMLTGLVMSLFIFMDKVMSYWGAYVSAPAINGRPIATIGDRTPNLGGNFWVQALDTYTHLLLPTLTLVLIGFAGYTRYSRASMLEVMSQDYIRTARAKGLPERTVVMRHGFRNSLIPLATIIPIDIITLLGGAIITEQVFGRPGMGTMFIRALRGSEIEPVMAYLVIVGGLAILANIVADLMYAALDPRIRVDA